MNINFAGAFQSVQVKSVQAKPHIQTADVATPKHKTVSPERNIKDAYVPSTTDSVVTDKPRVAFKFPSILTDSFKMQRASDIVSPKSVSVRESIRDESVPFTPVSAATAESESLTDSSKTQEVSPPMSLPTTINVDRTSIGSIISSVIGQTLEANGITLKEGEHIVLNLNGKGEFSVDTSHTRIDGERVDDTFSELFAALSDKVNEEIGEDKAFDSTQFKAFAATMGLHFEHIDLEKIKDDPNFSLSFVFSTHSETKEPKVMKAFVFSTEETFHRESFLAAGGIAWGNSKGNVFIAPGYQQFNKDDLAANFNGEPWNAYNSAARRAAVSQWERDNNFSFGNVRREGAQPLTYEEKQHYNEMLKKAHSEGIFPLENFLGNLNRIPGTDWSIADGAEALIGHEILGMLEKSMLPKSVEMWNMYGPVNQRINEYGFTLDIPASYMNVHYTTGLLDIPGINFFSTIPKTWSPVVSPDGTIKELPLLLPDMDGSQTFTPEIHFKDALGLGGMSLADRKVFLEMTQKILDNVMPGMDARQLTYTTGYLTATDMRNNKLSLTLTDVSWLTTEQRNTLERALNQNRQLFEMKHRADQSNNKGLGEFTMSVLDANGNALAKDQVRLIAGGKSVITSVDSIKDMDQQQIFAFINR